MTIEEKLKDLIVQATNERSHYYVKKVAEEALAEIERLKEFEWKYNDLCK